MNFSFIISIKGSGWASTSSASTEEALDCIRSSSKLWNVLQNDISRRTSR